MKKGSKMYKTKILTRLFVIALVLSCLASTVLSTNVNSFDRNSSKQIKNPGTDRIHGDRDTDTLPSRDIVPNPELPSSCGIDMVLVLDSSSSIDETELSQMKNAFIDFVGAFLPDTATHIAVVEFDTIAHSVLDYTTDIPTIDDAINSASSGGTTNWEDALLKAHELFDNRLNKPDLYVFASDGNPNCIGIDGIPASESEAVDAAVVQADQIKSDGVRIITLGIGDGLDPDNLIAISSEDAYYDSDFDILADTLADLANDLCGGTITVRKFVDGEPAEGWEFTATVTDGTANPPLGVTDVDGFIVFDIELDEGVTTAYVDITETLQPEYVFVGATATNCSDDPVGMQGVNSIIGIPVESNCAIYCEFFNTQEPIDDPPNYTITGLAGYAKDINNFGQVVGWQGGFNNRACLWQPEDRDSYYVIDLGTLGDWRGSKAYGINDYGQIVGTSYTNYGDPTLDAFEHAFILNPEDVDDDGDLDWYYNVSGLPPWQQGRNDLMQDLGTLYFITLDGVNFYTPPTEAFRINDYGEVVGDQILYSGDGYTAIAFKVTPDDTDGDGVPDVWNRDVDLDGLNDLMEDLGSLGGDYDSASAVAINNDYSNIVGSSWDNTPGDEGSRAVLWNDTTGIQNLGCLSGCDCKSWAYGINNLNQVVGASWVISGDDDSTHAFLWNPDEYMQDLGTLEIPSDTLEMSESGALDINDYGQIAGYSTFYPDDMATQCATILVPLDYNNDNVPDLWYYNASGYLPSEGANDLMFNLRDLIPPPTGTDWYDLRYAIGINNVGQILVRGFCHNDLFLSFVMTPVATIISARSCMDHGGTEWFLNLDESNHIESRMNDVTTIEFDLSRAVREGEVSASVECINDPDYEPTIEIDYVDDDTIRVQFDPVLPDENCSIIMLTGDIVDIYPVRMLVGDVDFSGLVSGGDRSTVKGQILKPLTDQPPIPNFWMDIDASGAITGGDRSTVKARIGNTVPEWP